MNPLLPVQLLIFSLPALIYVVAYKWSHRKRPWREAWAQMGFQVGPGRAYLWALALTLPALGFAALASSLFPPGVMEQEKLMSGAYAGVPLTAGNLFVAFWNTAVVTALSEEILFRGFLAGLLHRRMPLWWANLAQATLFVLPHLLILTVDVRLWPFAVVSPLISGLIFGWLRLRYGSIYPGWIVHGIANFAAVLGMMGG